MKQFYEIKNKYPGAILLFRVGDFYETFEDDAVTASKVLGITLTKRANGTASEVALAGFPHHSLDTYLPKLVRAGHRVAVCDQLEDPKMTKTIVKRGVTELVTPGVATRDHVLQQHSNNFLCALHIKDELAGIALLDISTGEFYVSQGHKMEIERLIQAQKPNEVIYNKKQFDIPQWLGEKFYTFPLDEWLFEYDFAKDLLINHFKTHSIKGFGLEDRDLAVIASGVVLHYLKQTEHHNLKHILPPSRVDIDDYVRLDKFTIRNLELLHTEHDEGTSLFQILNQTLTPPGARLLNRWLAMPLKDKKQIETRLNIVEAFMDDLGIAEQIAKELNHLGDLERLIAKIGLKRIGPREMVFLKYAMKKTASIKSILEKYPNPLFNALSDVINPCLAVIDKIEKSVCEEAPLSFQKKGEVIRKGVDEELDRLREIAFGGKNFLANMQKEESEKTGITSLKIGFNNVFGYYLEVTNAHKDRVPEDWIRKQTLVNAERYITPELKEYEEQILTAEDKISVLEQRIFNDLVLSVEPYIETIQINAQILAKLDVLLSFSNVSRKNKYVKPVLCEDNVLEIFDGRHPVIEKTLPVGESFVPNSLHIDDKEQQIIVITGPNMSGKSAFLRQTALIVIMAQMGCYVPAKKVNMRVVDKIFTRVGAADNLSMGESTFMVEMNETASILNNCSENSLILLDEIGRGTSTFDGISIAWAIAEYLHDSLQNKPKTLFSTHYHELNELESMFSRIKNFHFSVKEVNEQVLFLRKLRPGGSEHSFGIHVAQMSGMPQWIVKRAEKILESLEKSRSAKGNVKDKVEANKMYQMKLFEVEAITQKDEISQALKVIDVNSITPVEALIRLSELKKMMKDEK